MAGFIYHMLIRLLGATIRLAALCSPKARQWVGGRKGRFALMAAQRAARPGPLVWFHCASLGEFEQGRPVIEAFRRKYPAHSLLLTFFSPSGYEVRKDYQGADHVHYLPLDTPANARRFVDTWRPQMAVFVKYEFWFNYLQALQERKVPAVVVSAIFRPGQYFFRWYGRWARRQLARVSWFFVQNGESLQLLQSIGVSNASVAGDTRFDRVSFVSQNPRPFPELEAVFAGRPLLVAGSTWPADEGLLLHLYRNAGTEMNLLIAPHEVTESGIARLLREFGPTAVRFSALEAGTNIPDSRVVVVDRIGLLSRLYQYAAIAYIGGGFGKGIHNILEAAAYGVPVFFGPVYRRFAEAVDLVVQGGAFVVQDKESLLLGVQALLSDPARLGEASAISGRYVEEKKGGTELILSSLKSFIEKQV